VKSVYVYILRLMSVLVLIGSELGCGWKIAPVVYICPIITFSMHKNPE